MVLQSEATHNRGGEITFTRIGALTYKVNITTYTAIGAAADRPKLWVDFGDGTGDSVVRQQITMLTAKIQRNDYEVNHKFPAQGRYFVSVNDPNRNAGVMNIPNSVNTPFHIESMLILDPFLNPSNSVRLLNPPIDFGCVGRIFVHNPNAFDPDGDSLSFEIIDCRGEFGLPIPGYSLPPGNISLDSKTGQFIWDSPTLVGEYNFAFIIKEWRHGVLIGSVIRDIQVDITNCSNRPPEIQVLRDTCVKAEDTLSVLITATDPDNDRITLSANGGPFEFSPNSATFSIVSRQPGRTIGRFTWNPPCEAVRKESYQVLFKAEDEPPSGQIALVDLEPWSIQVLAPPPTLLNASSAGGRITINWDNSTTCRQAFGYKIYRKQGGPAGIIPSDCETGVPEGSGYVEIDTVMGFNTTTYVDDNKGAGLASGVEYCYVVTSFYALTQQTLFDDVESCHSNELCEIVKRDMPVITKADVETTSNSLGEIQVEWSAPIDLDTAQFPGPYKMELYRSPGIFKNTNQSTLLTTLNYNDFASISSGAYLDQGLNTESSASAYWMEFYYGNGERVGLAKSSSSVFLIVKPLPNSLELSWTYNTGWTNDSFIIYREEPGGYQAIDTVLHQQFYVDLELTDGQTYCYYVESIGSFNKESKLPEGIRNKSQKSCNIPRDTVPPCAPVLELESECKSFYNSLQWMIEDSSCIADLRGYRIYLQAFDNEPFVLIDSVGRGDSTFRHNRDRYSVAGCYAVVAYDSSYNESAFSNVICVDNCPDYRLPNVFTPGTVDQKNDLFRPFPYRSIERVEMQIFNRWGQLVYKTEDPDINWDGKNRITKRNCPPSTYFYICKVFDVRREGIGLEPFTIKGSIKLIRNTP